MFSGKDGGLTGMSKMLENGVQILESAGEGRAEDHSRGEMG